jgi:cell division septation protein DedD
MTPSNAVTPPRAVAAPVPAAPILATAAPVVNPPAPTADRRPPTGTVFSVQLAAYDAEAPAEALVERLRGRGIDARVSGSVRPFRVRVGRFATRAEAEREAVSLKKRGQSAWVVEERIP